MAPHYAKMRTDPPAGRRTHGRPVLRCRSTGVLRNAVQDCGWGRLLFGQTFSQAKELARALAEEKLEWRDIAIYVQDPHVVLAADPQRLFLDPSHTYRLDLSTFNVEQQTDSAISIRPVTSLADCDGINCLYAAHNMVRVPDDFFWVTRSNSTMTVLVAEDVKSGAVIGTVTGIDHCQAFGDPEKGSSLWCLAVHPQAPQPGIGECLVRSLAAELRG